MTFYLILKLMDGGLNGQILDYVPQHVELDKRCAAVTVQIRYQVLVEITVLAAPRRHNNAKQSLVPVCYPHLNPQKRSLWSHN